MSRANPSNVLVATPTFRWQYTSAHAPALAQRQRRPSRECAEAIASAFSAARMACNPPPRPCDLQSSGKESMHIASPSTIGKPLGRLRQIHPRLHLNTAKRGGDRRKTEPIALRKISLRPADEYSRGHGTAFAAWQRRIRHWHCSDSYLTIHIEREGPAMTHHNGNYDSDRMGRGDASSRRRRRDWSNQEEGLMRRSQHANDPHWNNEPNQAPGCETNRWRSQ